jgi:hypothetical protein
LVNRADKRVRHTHTHIQQRDCCTSKIRASESFAGRAQESIITDRKSARGASRLTPFA